MNDALAQDLRYAWRRSRERPGFSIIVVVTLALGIGANTALFSLLNAVVLRSLPLQHPGNLVAVSRANEVGQVRWMPLSAAIDLCQRQQVFQGCAGYSGGGLFTIEANGVLAQSMPDWVTGQYFSTLGVRPFLGRLISDEDVPPEGEPTAVAVLTHHYWKSAFAGDPRVLGQTVRLDGVPLTIVGVTPPGFSGLQTTFGADLSVPATMLARITKSPTRRNVNYVIARLHGATLDQARTHLVGLWPGVRSTAPVAGTPEEQREFRSSTVLVEGVHAGFSFLRNLYRSPLFMLQGLSVLLLLLACVNLSGLLLARIQTRQRDLDLCVALGATRWRLVQQGLVETVGLAIAGAVIAVPLAWWGTKEVARVMWTGAMPPNLSVTPDARVLATTAAAAVASGIVVAVIPVLTVTGGRKRSLVSGIRTPTSRTRHLGRILVAAQVALSLVFLFCGGLLARTLVTLRGVDPGFRADRLLLAGLMPQPNAPKIDDDAYYPELVREVSALTGVESAALSRLFPFITSDAAGLLRPVRRDGAPARSDDATAVMDAVSPRFFETVGIALKQGRDFNWSDGSRTPPVAIVNESLARRLAPGGSAISQRIRLGTNPNTSPVEIVGIAADATLGSLRTLHVPTVFRPTLQESSFARYSTISIRTGSDSSMIGKAVRRSVPMLGRHYVQRVQMAEDQLVVSTSREYVIAVIASLFAALAVVLAGIGLYGLIAHKTAARTREIGLRLALGASRAAVVLSVVRWAFGITLVGVAVGVPLALAAGRVTGTLLFGVTPFDPVTLVFAGTLLAALGSVAALVPALRASRLDPAVALRCE